MDIAAIFSDTGSRSVFNFAMRYYMQLFFGLVAS